ncbi:hypothetical protein GCM10010420_51340 [Streptomyces glaucosporus]|uniref:Protein kinase domain-containing protein n=1 Tax=Streptomyces glaucosporus TaxID=284044 RepID=A0ABN3IXP2_9ACTN
MDDYSGRLLADRYRLPRPPSDEYELVESRAYDTASGQEVTVRQVPLPEVVEAEFVGGGAGRTGGHGGTRTGRATRRPADPTVRRAVEAALAAARIPDHPRLDQVFDVFVEGDGLWIVSELVAARPLAALLAEKPLSPHRAAELADDLLTALRVVHAHGWVHRNITPHTVLVCDDGRAVLTGLAAGAAEEALCGYDPLPAPPRGRPQEEPPGLPGGDAGPFRGGVPRQTSGPGSGPHQGGLPALPEGYRKEDGDLGPVIPGVRGEAPGGGGADTDPPAARWDENWEAGDGDRYRGPATALAAERARQARITTVGAVTERWAPEQAGPVYENWRLAPPVGPAADLWALGALLFRAVQGHAPYPEDSAAELVQMVCAEPPAFAEECGALRPVVESLLRQDPTERPDAEELGGWLRSLIRSAPEPEVGLHTVTVPLSLEAGRAADPRRLPIVRRRGELVRRKRAERAPVPARARHRRARKERSPRRLGCALVGLVLLLLTGTLVYAALFMPGADTGSSVSPRDQRAGRVETGPGESGRTSPESSAPSSAEPSGPGEDGGTASPGAREPRTTESAQGLDGYVRHKDDRGFQIAVPEGWRRSGPNGSGQVVFRGQGVELVVVPGRDTTEEYGDDPMAYLTGEQPELDAYRASEWATSSGMRRIEVGRTVMAEGRFSWTDDRGDTYMRNRAIVIGDRYHTVLIRGPENRKATVDRHFDALADTYRFTG